MTGLTTTEAAHRYVTYGANEIEREPATSRWRMLARQFASPIIWLLLGAAGVSAALGELVDAIAIGAILVINALVGFLQEYRAERAILALRSMTAPRAHVVRDDHQTTIAASEVVPGDLLVLEAGDIVAADGDLVEAHALATNEAALTGESMPARKSLEPHAADAPLAERSDHVYLGTSVATGTGRAQVTATGMQTELGHIARLLATAGDQETPLQRRLAQVSRTLLVATVVIVAVVAVVGLFRGIAVFDVFLAAVALAVAAVPEALPAVVTIALAIGVRRMAARRALVRRLPAVETLGCTTVICTDKTGTLTTGVMTVRTLWGPDHVQVLAAAAACCDAELGPSGGVGDPTELAILEEAALHEIRQPAIESARPRVTVIPFDPERKYMAIQRADETIYVKGAVEVILARCTEAPDGAREAAAELATHGLRVLAVAVGQGVLVEAGPTRLKLVGLIGLADPPRPEAIRAIAAARRAGIRTVMITGDHAETATAIARELGIVADGESVDGLVYARATPEQKLAIVRDLKQRGEIVAMTGDGVNDAPALREAHVGIAMGKTGTEVTREVSDIVLADDNFATIVEAIREGRGIFANIRKALVFVLAGNVAELSVMLIASLAGLPLPLLPLQLLWINLVTDGMPALALVMDPAERQVMEVPPRAVAEPILGAPEWGAIAFAGVIETAVTLSAYVWALETRDVAVARGLAFSVLVFSQMFVALSARDTKRLFWEVGALGNLVLLLVIGLTVVAQYALFYVVPARVLFDLPPLSVTDGLLALGLGLVPVTVIELTKLGIRLASALRSRSPLE